MYSISLRNVLRLVLVAALAGFALVVTPPDRASAAAAAPCRRTFTDVVDEEIPSPGSTESTIDVPEDGLVVTDVEIAVDIRHPSPRHLTLLAGSRADLPGGGFSLATLFLGTIYGSSTSGSDILATFDDEARIPITWGRAPFTGPFLPVEPLAALAGRSGGQFALNVGDSDVAGVGTLKRWSLTLAYATCDFDTDGVEDHADQCRDLTARTATGCPSASRKVTAKYKAGKFRGVLTSPVAGCKAGRAVSVFRKRPGPDRRVGAATTRADSSFRLARAKKRGRYYAFSPLVAVANRAECPAVTSSFRIR